MTADIFEELQDGVAFVVQGLSKLTEDGDIGQTWSEVWKNTWIKWSRITAESLW